MKKGGILGLFGEAKKILLTWKGQIPKTGAGEIYRLYENCAKQSLT
jgi:hypothetical protein